MAQPLINISSRHAYVFAAFLVLYEFLTYVANDMIMPGMIHVVQTFNGPESAVANSLTAYILGGASLQIFLGPISDRYGRRPVMIFGAILFFLCTLFIAASNSMEQFLIARFFQGMGLCFIGVVGYATIQEIFAEMDAIRLIAIMANVSILAPLIGPLLGALFINYYSWRIIFVIIAMGSVVALIGLWRYMPEPVGQVKRDGEEIKRVPLKAKIIFANYTKLIINRTFFLGSIAVGLLITPCVAWIALAPLILIADAKLSVIQYAIWQIPVFGAAILGTWTLRLLTNYFSTHQILKIGAFISVFSLLLTFILPFITGNYFIWLMPGIILYFFSLGMSDAPLMRLILFSTPVAKGTASALTWLIAMCLQAGGVELANIIYTPHNNLHFGFYCAILGLVYILVLLAAFVKERVPRVC